jgi:hypothetical protein
VGVCGRSDNDAIHQTTIDTHKADICLDIDADIDIGTNERDKDKQFFPGSTEHTGKHDADDRAG